MKYVLAISVVVFWAAASFAQTYPTCPSGNSSTTGCTIPVLITATATPVFDKLSARQYLLLQNQGYTNTTLNNNPMCCAIGAAAVWDGTHPCNGIVIQPGGTYPPAQIIKPQNPFTVPSGSISCIAPLGNTELTGEQE